MVRSTKRVTSSSEESPVTPVTDATEAPEAAIGSPLLQEDVAADAFPEPAVVDTKAEPPAASAVTVTPVQKSRGLSAILGGGLAAALGFGLAQFVPDGWPIADTSALDSLVQTQAKEIDALKQAIAALPPDQPAPDLDLSPLTKAIEAVSDRVTALESSSAGSVDLTAISEAIARLETDLATLKAAGPGTTAATALAAEAEARLKEAEVQAAQMKAEAEALTRAASSRAALGRLQAALDRGAPFAAILPDLGVDVPAALGDHAEAGLPSLDGLKSAFPAAARAALDASLRADMGDTWSERATSFLFSQTGARSLTPREGNDPDAVLSRAEAALGVGDLDLALTELDALPDVARAAMIDWRALAEQRQAGLKAMAYVASKIEG